MKARSSETVYRGFPLGELETIRNAWDRIREKGNLSSNPTYLSYLDSLTFESLDGKSGSLIVSATYTPVKYSKVHFKNREYVIRTPHQYYKADFSRQTVGQYIAGREGLKKELTPVRDIPMKLTASMCGLTRYGRNNIAYTEEYGSYITLMAFHTEETSFRNQIKNPERMDRCESCRSCVTTCPGSALEKDQVLDVENCITLYNEIEGEFPEPVLSMAHNALMGCLICQDKCPVNSSIDARMDGEPLNEEEALSLYNRRLSEPGLRGLEKLLAVSDRKSLEENYPVYARNFHFAMKNIAD